MKGRKEEPGNQEPHQGGDSESEYPWVQSWLPYLAAF